MIIFACSFLTKKMSTEVEVLQRTEDQSSVIPVESTAAATEENGIEKESDEEDEVEVVDGGEFFRLSSEFY